MSTLAVSIACIADGWVYRPVSMMGKYKFVNLLILYELVICTSGLLLGFIGFIVICEICFVLKDDFLLRFKVGYLFF